MLDQKEFTENATVLTEVYAARCELLEKLKEIAKEWNGKVYTKNFRAAIENGLADHEKEIKTLYAKNTVRYFHEYMIKTSERNCEWLDVHFCRVASEYEEMNTNGAALVTAGEVKLDVETARDTLLGGFRFSIKDGYYYPFLRKESGRRPRISAEIMGATIGEMLDKERAQIAEIEKNISEYPEILKAVENVRRAAATVKSFSLDSTIRAYLMPYGGEYDSIFYRIHDPAETTETAEATEKTENIIIGNFPTAETTEEAETTVEEIAPINAGTGKEITGKNADTCRAYLAKIGSDNANFYTWSGAHRAGLIVKKGEKGIALTAYPDGKPMTYYVWHASQLAEKATVETVKAIKRNITLKKKAHKEKEFTVTMH